MNIQQLYKQVKQKLITESQFLQQVKNHPLSKQWFNQFTSPQDAIKILKNKQIISENLVAGEDDWDDDEMYRPKSRYGKNPGAEAFYNLEKNKGDWKDEDTLDHYTGIGKNARIGSKDAFSLNEYDELHNQALIDIKQQIEQYKESHNGINSSMKQEIIDSAVGEYGLSKEEKTHIENTIFNNINENNVTNMRNISNQLKSKYNEEEIVDSIIKLRQGDEFEKRRLEKEFPGLQQDILKMYGVSKELNELDINKPGTGTIVKDWEYIQNIYDKLLQKWSEELNFEGDEDEYEDLQNFLDKYDLDLFEGDWGEKFENLSNRKKILVYFTNLAKQWDIDLNNLNELEHIQWNNISEKDAKNLKNYYDRTGRLPYGLTPQQYQEIVKKHSLQEGKKKTKNPQIEISTIEYMDKNINKIKDNSLKKITKGNNIDKTNSLKPVKGVKKIKQSAKNSTKETVKPVKGVQTMTQVPKKAKGITKIMEIPKKEKTLNLKETIDKIVAQVIKECQCQQFNENNNDLKVGDYVTINHPDRPQGTIISIENNRAVVRGDINHKGSWNVALDQLNKIKKNVFDLNKNNARAGAGMMDFLKEEKASSFKIGQTFTMTDDLGNFKKGEKVEVIKILPYGNDIELHLMGDDGKKDVFYLDKNEEI